jgi:hypothetical protein
MKPYFLVIHQSTLIEGYFAGGTETGWFSGLKAMLL